MKVELLRLYRGALAAISAVLSEGSVSRSLASSGLGCRAGADMSADVWVAMVVK